MVTAEPASRDDAWGSITGWHVAFGLILAICGLWVTIAADLSGARRALELALLALLGAGYLVLRPPVDGSAPWRSNGYLAVAVAVTVVACGLDPVLSMLLFIVYPQTWLVSGGRRLGAFWTALLALGSAAGFMTASGWDLGALRTIGPSALASLLFSLLLGLWISRIIDQSRDRADLIEQLGATRSELAEAHHAQGVAAERERLAREIHDTLAQGFTSIVMLAQAARTGDAAARLAAIEEVARLAGLDRDREVVLLRAVQEALANVRRHARASSVTVRLIADDAGARVEVVDDGVGFAPSAASGGFGLAGMRSRAHDVGGDVAVLSAPGRGTRVIVRVGA